MGRIKLWVGIALLAGACLIVIIPRLASTDEAESAEFSALIKHGEARGCNILLITLDTTRPDHLGCYGYTKAVTPNIDALARRGVRFDDAVTTVPLTLPAHASILTGLRPFRHGVRTNGGYRLAPEHLTLAEHLDSNGYATAAFVSCFVLDRRFGIGQGFATYDFAVSEGGDRGANSLFGQRNASDVTDAALGWLADRPAEQPYFLWVHYYDPHHPYEAPVAAGQPRPNTATARYDAEIAYMDAEIGRLLERVQAESNDEPTLIVAASDHGESLGEHGEDRHGLFIYEASMHAALIFSSPTLFERAYRVEKPTVSLVDVFPTIVDLLGLPAVPDLDGFSLIRPGLPAERTVYMESVYAMEGLGCSPLYGLRTHEEKFIESPIAEFYDLKKDPDELENIYSRGGTQIKNQADALKALMSQWPEIRNRDSSTLGQLSPDELARLEALGYAAPTSATTDRPLPDAKEQLPLIEGLARAVKIGKQGRLQEALQLALDIAEETEGYDTSAHTVAHIYEAMGRHQDAIDTLERYVAKYPSVNLYLQLAKNYAKLKQWDEFERVLAAAEVLDPLRGSIALLRGDQHFAKKRYRAALREYEHALAIDHHRVEREVRPKIAAARKWLAAEPPAEDAAP
jgi:choline-sulfatase